MTPFWILLFIICVPKTGSTGENPADHGHYTHDAAMISRLHDAHHFWRQEHQTFSGSIKARERPQKRGRAGEAGGKSRTETKKKQEDEWKTNNTGEGRKKKNKETGGRGRNRRHTDEEKKNRDYTEKERKAEEQHRDEYWLCHCLRPYRKRKTHNHSKQIHSRLASSSSS